MAVRANTKRTLNEMHMCVADSTLILNFRCFESQISLNHLNWSCITLPIIKCHWFVGRCSACNAPCTPHAHISFGRVSYLTPYTNATSDSMHMYTRW